MSITTKSLTQDELKSLIRYEPETGKFIRFANPVKPLNNAVAAGSKCANGYIYINVFYVKHLAHRLAFLYMTGSFPTNHVDHINGNRTDNRWENLRAVTHSENMQNLGSALSNNKSGGLLGVSFSKQYQRYDAEITVNGKSKYLGRFKTSNEAHDAYLKAKKEMHPFSNRIFQTNINEASV